MAYIEQGYQAAALDEGGSAVLLEGGPNLILDRCIATQACWYSLSMSLRGHAGLVRHGSWIGSNNVLHLLLSGCL
jgi:hypothetical protein